MAAGSELVVNAPTHTLIRNQETPSLSIQGFIMVVPQLGGMIGQKTRKEEAPMMSNRVLRLWLSVCLSCVSVLCVLCVCLLRTTVAAGGMIDDSIGSTHQPTFL